MSARRGTSDLSGILLVDKPSGMTSHDVVNRVRRATSERRVGHAGTLDPMATGLLVVLVGPATRLAPYLTSAEKVYEARVAFGFETDTDDIEGQVTREVPAAPELFDSEPAAGVVSALVGMHQQVPPAFSAIKRDGVVAYDAARKGDPLELEAREVEVVEASLVGVSAEALSWDIRLSVSKGTYIRAIARDLGRELGSAAHLSALRRVRSGSCSIEDAHTLAEIEDAGAQGRVSELFANPFAALGLPVVPLNAQGAARVFNGSALDPKVHCADGCPAGGLVAVEYEGALLALYSVIDSAMKASVVIPGGVRGSVA